MSWSAPVIQYFVAIGLGVLLPYTWICRVFDATSTACSFWGFFNKAAYTLERIFTQNTSEDVASGKEVLLWVTMTKFFYKIYTVFVVNLFYK